MLKLHQFGDCKRQCLSRKKYTSKIVININDMHFKIHEVYFKYKNKLKIQQKNIYYANNEPKKVKAAILTSYE